MDWMAVGIYCYFQCDDDDMVNRLFFSPLGTSADWRDL